MNMLCYVSQWPIQVITSSMTSILVFKFLTVIVSQLYFVIVLLYVRQTLVTEWQVNVFPEPE